MRFLAGFGFQVALATVLLVIPALAQEMKDIALPAPQTEGGRPLMQVLKDRQSVRAFSDQKLSPQMLADLLWAAAGISRPESGKRTAPSARNWQEVEVYVVMEEGAYRYDAQANALKAIVPGDLRGATGMQDFVAVAPVNLVFVADLAKLKDATAEDQALYAGADTGFISENVYLFCASAGLGTVVRGSVDRKSLAEALKLPEDKKIMLAQTVGFPKTEARP